MSIDESLSLRLRAVAFFCALLVVPIHCWSLSSWAGGTSGLSSTEAGVLVFLTASITRFAVPCFFVLTGFFLALGYEESWAWYGKTLKKRAVSVYLPFLIWNILNVVLALALQKGGGASFLRHIQSVVGVNPYVSPACMQFWYLQTVIIWVLVSPCFLWVLRRRWAAPLLVIPLAVGWVMGYRYSPYAISPWAFLWLSVGTLAAFNLTRLTEIGARFRRPSIRIVIAFGLLLVLGLRVLTGVHFNRTLYFHAESLVILLGVVNVFLNSDVLARLLRPVQSLWGLGFFVYAFHTIAISVLIVVFSRNGVSEFTLTLIKIFGAIAVSLIVGYGFRRLMPRAFGIMTGGRG